MQDEFITAIDVLVAFAEIQLNITRLKSINFNVHGKEKQYYTQKDIAAEFD